MKLNIMKKLLFMAIFLLMAGAAAKAQYYYPAPRPRPRYHRPVIVYRQQRKEDDFYKPRVGLTGNVNIANIVSNNYDNFNTSSKVGVSAGLTFDLPVAYPFSIAPEILYSQKGYRANVIDAAGNNASFTQRADFLDIPVLAKFKLVPGFNFLIGPQFSFLLSTRNTYYNGFDVASQSKYNYNGDRSFVDGVIGVSFDLNRNVELRARYTVDLSENYPNGDTSDDIRYRNQVWQFGIGFKF